jgi:bifunctional DNA-binding transcriptional regulator/antitoxin component of YhaV-PrlF toxin-antitoxin module
MGSLSDLKVSNRGQLRLPATVLRQWGLENGGEIAVIDVGGALLLLPGGVQVAKAALHAATGEGRYERAVAQIRDRDLSN